MLRITSPANPRIKETVRLRDHRHRIRQRRTLVDGLREVTLALRRPGLIREIYYVPQACTSPQHRLVFEAASRESIDVVEVSPAVLSKLAYGDRNDGLVAVAHIPDTSLASLSTPNVSLVLVLEQVEKPGNVGAVLRTADAAGAALILAEPRTDLFNPNSIRASLGTVFHVPVAEGSNDEVRAWLAERSFDVFAARVDAERIYWEADFQKPAALVLGSESRGLSSSWSGPGILGLRLPMRGEIDSLNVSITAAVLAYEVVRQRSIGPPPAAR